MTNSEDRPPPAVGAYWINEEDYPALLRIFADGDRMPRTWSEWLKIAEEMEQGLKAYGHVVMRVRIASASVSLHATPPPNTMRVRPCSRAARYVFSTSVSINAS